ncbi:MAG: replication restart helicase PriA [Desulfocapsaceae bacterium]
MILLEVAVTAPVKQTYTYAVGEENLFGEEAERYIGRRVLVPFGRRPVTGYVLGRSKINAGDFQIKSILKIMDEVAYFLVEQVPFFKWVADYYHYPLGLVIKTALPGGMSAAPKKTLCLTDRGSDMVPGDLPVNTATIPWLVNLLKRGKLSSSETSKLLSSNEDKDVINTLIGADIIDLQSNLVKDRVRAKTEICFALTQRLKDCFDDNSDPEIIKQLCEATACRSLTGAEFKALTLLNDMQKIQPEELVPRKEISKCYPYGERLLNKLTAEELVAKINRRVYRSPFGDLLPFYPRPNKLSDEQASAIQTVCQAIKKQHYQPFLLYGVTGSGKTEVYLEAAEEAVSRGRRVLVLVPEIALATQIEAHFISRFKGKVALLHSGLTAGERFDEWYRVLTNDASIVIGARSAVFSPLDDIGLIIVDEEHDTSFKQEDGLRYNGRDLALVRAQLAGCAVILGSATPSIISHYHSRSSKYHLLEMTKRIGERELPQPCLVDLKSSSMKKGASLFHPELQKGLEETFGKSQQSILLLNRRGFATSVICSDCGTVVECSNCKVSLNRHRQKNLLLCHYCGFSLSGAVSCRECSSSNLNPIGFGTERVEEEAKILLPEANIARLDSDVAADRRRFLKILKSMQDREIDVLVGTQIIAKGLHFPHVSLVGIVTADSGLGFPDFRAAEKTYQLITQVTGRAGRGEVRGKVIIQTHQPDHYAISLAAANNYEALVERELAVREEVVFPPFCRLVFIIVEDREDQVARKSSKTIVEMARDWCRTHDPAQVLTVLGPAPAPLERLRDRYRWQILLKSSKLQPLHSLVEWISTTYQSKSQTRVIVDIDPENML